MPQPGEGSSWQGSEIDFILKDMLQGMGDFMASNLGSLAWCEALVCSRMLTGALNYFRLIGSQIEPATCSVYLDRWQSIYNVNDTPLNSINYFKQVESLIGTPPTLSNITAYCQKVLGQVFVDLRVLYQIQYLATRGPTSGDLVYPLSNLWVHMFQPRDKNDNKLMTDAQFANTINQYKRIVEAWIPAYSTARNMIFYNTGKDGFSLNTVTISANSKVVVGTNTQFTLDFADVYNNVISDQYFDVIDDNNMLETLDVITVVNDTSMILALPAQHSITARVYRTFGARCDVMPSCDQALMNE